jgi:hypothetical protein
MAVEVVGTAIMDNHLHVILRNRPDLVEKWSNLEVATKWLKVCPGERQLDPMAPPIEPTAQQIKELLVDKSKVTVCRARLASLSWMMKLLKEPISRSANAEDGLTGHFWEGKFKSTRLLDIYAIVLCVMYVDLNEIRAGKATTPETSVHSSAYLRIQARLARLEKETEESGERREMLAAAWLSPIEEEADPPDGPQADEGRRASDQGFLPMSVEKYLVLLVRSPAQGRKAGHHS